MRTPGVQSQREPILFGDEALARRLAASLVHDGPVDRATHGFHTWPAGLHPDTARDLVAAFPGGSVLDPFCGGGTVVLEALLAGRRAVGRDVSPVALRAARGRCTPWDEAALSRARAIGRKATADARKASDLPPPRVANVLREWYHEHVLFELEAIRRAIAASTGPERQILELVFSAILVKVSHRVSDTSPRRDARDRPAGTTAVWFHKKLREYGRRAKALRDAVPAGTPPADLAHGDARRLALRDKVDLVLTSPPYPGTYDYQELQHLRNVWFEDEVDPNREIGSRQSFRAGEAQARRQWTGDTAAWTAAVAGVLRPGGTLVVVVGDGLVPGGTVDTSEVTEAAARAGGLASIARASVERTDFARETTRWEHVFAFRAS